MNEAREEMQDAQSAAESPLDEEEKKIGSSPESLKQVWAIGGGKGGVGKTLVTANFAITLARAGAKVVVVDLDLGGANLHTCLGVDVSRHTLTDLFSPEVRNLEDLAVPTVIPNLSLISGAQDSVQVANLPHAQK
ncbi:MAG: P-loop NTPase, partial [Bdellovibrionales bacterium]|nr:P-loop NTPase [Bdellovibrionales bacterium]